MKLFKSRTAIGVLCILLSLVICFVVTPLFSRSASQKTEVLRVQKEIQVGAQITNSMVQLVEVGGFNLPPDVLRDKAQVVGQYATAAMFAGDLILPQKLSPTPANENAYLYSLDGSMQAMSVTIKTFAGGLSGKLLSGDVVSVIAPDYRKLGETVIPPALQYVEVIGVTAASGYDATEQDAQQGKDERELPATVTLLVSPEQSKALAELESEGKLHLSLVYCGNVDKKQSFLDTQSAYIKANADAAIGG